MDHAKHRAHRRKRRHHSLRKRLIGTAERPRLAVFRSLKHLYVQVIDDMAGHTLASASTREKSMTGAGCNCAAAEKLGKAIAERAKEKGITAVRFDRGGFKYHGRVKSLADAVRKEGITF